MKKSTILKATLCSLTAAHLAEAAPSKAQASVECYGINTEKGVNGCAIEQKQIDAANKAYKDQFNKSKPMDCSGNSEGTAKDGYLAWISKASNEECFKAGGFVFEKQPDGSLAIKDKDGIKK